MRPGQSPSDANLVEVLREQLSSMCGHRVEIAGLRRLTGGTSHDSWAFDLHNAGKDGAVPLILRRDFGNEQLDLDLGSEFELLGRLYGAGLSVPKPIWVGDAASVLGSSFIISERFSGGDLRKQMAARGIDRCAMGRSLTAALAQVHKLEWRRVLKEFWFDPGQSAALDQVRRWERVAGECAQGPDPLLAAAMDWLAANAPMGAPVCLVHADFKANNIVADEYGRIAIIDWELAHLGDPLEDVAWTMLWTTQHDLVGGMLSEEEFLRVYEAEMGTAIDHQRLGFWRMFALAKLAAIFLKSMRLHGDGSPLRPTHLMLGRAMPWIQGQLAERLDKVFAGGCRA